MSELRKEPIAQRWVVITQPEETSAQHGCPFCPGHEGDTPPELYAVRGHGTEPNTPGWQVRIVPNKYPFLHPEGELMKRGVGISDAMNGIGAHEIVVETPEHAQRWATMPAAQLANVFSAYRQRLLALRRDARLKYIVVVKNHGTFAGRLSHPHSHVVGFPVVPKRIEEELGGTFEYYQFHERCIYCDMMREETGWHERLILETVGFLALAPFASRYPFEVWVIPKDHVPDFAQIEELALFDLAQLMRRLFHAIEKALDDPFYSVALHSTPLQERFQRQYHWHVEIRPRVGHPTGFEWATGVFINPIPPEEAAARLRRAIDS